MGSEYAILRKRIGQRSIERLLLLGLVEPPTLSTDSTKRIGKAVKSIDGKKMVRQRTKAFEAISLFSGAMGFDLGLERSGFKVLACNDIDPTAVATIKKNRPDLPILEESIEKITAAKIAEATNQSVTGVDLVVGGPPCQAFSVFGQRRGIEDSRGRLIFEFVRLISELRPKVFVMENVRGLHSMPLHPKTEKREKSSENGSLLSEVFRRFEKVGYRVDCFLVNAANYGAPQIRERLICIGNRSNLEASFPGPQYSNRAADGLPNFRTLGDAIGDGFADPDVSLMNFSERKLKYLAMIPAGGNWRSLPVRLQKESMGKSWYLKGGRSAYWRKLSMEFPCPTVVTMPNHAGTSMCHPTELRALTVGELAAIQEFPRTWEFVGSPTDKCRQIGNAVPVRLGIVVGEAVKQLLARIDNDKESKSASLVPSKITHLRPHVRTKTYFKGGKAYAGDYSYYDDSSLNIKQSQFSF